MPAPAAAVDSKGLQDEVPPDAKTQLMSNFHPYFRCLSNVTEAVIHRECF